MSMRIARGSIAAAAVAVAVLAGVLFISSAAPTYPLSADFSSAQGLFPGAAVQVLGITVGSVTAVRNLGNHVAVSMKIDAGTSIPAQAHASLVAEQLLGEPDVQLTPAYTGGPRLSPGSAIPEVRTSVPVSANRMLKSLQAYLAKIDPAATGSLVHYLAQDLNGQGAALNSLIHNAAGTLRLLAAKGTKIGKMETALAQLTAALRSHTATITALIQDYDAVSSVVAANRTQLAQGITELVKMSNDLSALLDPNLQTIQREVPVITTAGRTLDRNLASLDETLSASVALFSAAGRAYDPAHRWLNLNNQLPPGTAGSVVTGLIRDRLAGVCRRLLAHHAQGLSPAEVATLRRCGNPYSGYFDPILGYVPELLSRLSGSSSGSSSGSASGASTPTAQQLFAKGLAAIPGLSSVERSSLAGAKPLQQPPGSSSSAPNLVPPTSSRGKGKSPTNPGSGSDLLGSPDKLLGPLPNLPGAGGARHGGTRHAAGGGFASSVISWIEGVFL